MKRFFFSLILFTFIAATQAQIVRGYGVKLGTTIAHQDWKYIPALNVNFNPDNRKGLNIGIFAELLNNPNLSIIVELNYVQKGMKKELEQTFTIDPDGTGKFITWDTRIDYINFSTLGKFRLNFGSVSPYIIAGPKIDREINKVFSLAKANTIEENYEKNRIGFKVGAGTEINLTSFALLIELLYDSDFNELYKNENLKINTNSLDLRIGLQL